MGRNIEHRWFIKVNEILLECTVDVEGLFQVKLKSELEMGDTVTISVEAHEIA